MRPFWVNAAAVACVSIALGHASVARSSDAAQPGLELGGMTFVASLGTENEVVLEAEQAQFQTGENVAHLQVVHLLLAPDREMPGLDMTADRGTIDIDTSNFDAEGNVRGTTGDGRRFRTQRLRYDHARGLVSTNAPVDIDDDAGSYRGKAGFRYFVRENRFQLRQAETRVQQ
jgi:LPS export ABC transporter protein LptC